MYTRSTKRRIRIWGTSLALHIKRHAAQHDCLPSLLGDEVIELNSEQWEKKIFVSGQLEQSTQDKNLMYRHKKPNKPTKDGPLSYVLLESPFASVSTVRGHRSLVSLGLVQPGRLDFYIWYTLCSSIDNGAVLRHHWVYIIL